MNENDFNQMKNRLMNLADELSRPPEPDDRDIRAFKSQALAIVEPISDTPHIREACEELRASTSVEEVRSRCVALSQLVSLVWRLGRWGG